jgi:hypothetical protein
MPFAWRRIRANSEYTRPLSPAPRKTIEGRLCAAQISVWGFA